MPNGDCQVNVSDLLAVIGDWGSDCVDKGSCCYDDGSCNDNVAEADCNRVHGVVLVPIVQQTASVVLAVQLTVPAQRRLLTLALATTTATAPTALT